MSALNATIEKIRTISNTHVNPLPTAGEENKDEIFLTMGAFEDFFIRFAEEKLNDTSPEFTYWSNKFGKSIVLVFVLNFVEGHEIFPRSVTVPLKFKLPLARLKRRDAGGVIEGGKGVEEEKEEE